MFIWILWAALPNNLTSRCWWNLWVTASWSEVQVTTWTCNWHQSSWRESLKLPAHCCCSVAELCPTIVIPWTAALQAPLSFIISQSLFKLMPIELVMLSNHLILCHPFLLLPPIFPSIRVFLSLQLISYKVITWLLIDFWNGGGEIL